VVDVLDVAILALRIALVALLYVFLALVLRLAVRGLLAAPRPRLRLEVVDAGTSPLTPGDVLEVADGAVLGRAARANLIFSDATVSSEHARVRRVGHVWMIVDLGSTNGTSINDASVEGEMPLASGDVLGIGNVRLRVVAR
jgi:predicted component of type VI protein secretion system